MTNDFPPRRGGIESFVYGLCRGLPPESVVVYTARMPGSAQVDTSVAYPVVRDRSRTLLPTPRVALAVRDVMHVYGCDRVVFGAAGPLGLLASRMRDAGATRIVAITHGHEVWWARVPLARRLLRRIGDTTDVMTYVSDFCRREIGAALTPPAACRMVRLSPGVDLDAFRPDLDGSGWRERLGIAAGRPVVLAASRLVARKGHDVLVEAWPRVLESCPDAVLLIVGDGPCRSRLQRSISSLREAVRMVASVPWSQMPQLYAAADVFALPCRTRRLGLEPEALGIVFLEAAATGLPVVVGRSGGAPEVVVDGETGYVVDPRSPSQVAAKIVMLLESPTAALAMGERGRRRVADRFSGDADRVLRELLMESDY